MTEQSLIDLKFTKNYVTKEESGADQDFHYYTQEFGDITLISNDNWDAEKTTWEVSIFDSETLKITDHKYLVSLYNVLNHNTIKDEMVD